MRCQALNAKGEPCGAPESAVRDNGFCPAHDPENQADMKELAMRGGRAAARRARQGEGINPDDLPPLNGPEDVETWLEIVGRAVVSQRINTSTAKTISRILRDWLSAHEAGSITRQLNELREALEEARETGDLDPVLEAVA